MNEVFSKELSDLIAMSQDIQNRLINLTRIATEVVNQEIAKELLELHNQYEANPPIYVPTAANGGLPADPAMPAAVVGDFAPVAEMPVEAAVAEAPAVEDAA